MALRKKVLIISAKAGAGHMRAAAALEEVFKESYPDVEVKNVDALEYANPAFRKTFSATYNILATDLPRLWAFMYETLEEKRPDAAMVRFVAAFDRVNGKGLIRLAREFAPDAIVGTHYLAAEVLARGRVEGTLKAPLNMVFTDYDIHTVLVQKGVDRFFVPTDEMAFVLADKGAGEAEILVHGIPLMPAFSREYPDRKTMREKLGLRTDARTVLLSAGGFGMLDAGDVVGKLADAVEDVQILPVAGKNETLKRALERAAKKHPGKIRPFGFVTNMHELMAASDVALAKSGGLTSSECLAMGLPMVVFKPIPGQEERNADYLLESGAALKANSTAHAVFKVKRLLSDRKLFARMQAAARAAARPRAAYDIVKDVMNTL